ncbi:MAG: hypothetical protein AAFN77_05310 [Planctomycetota bacterium]
MIIIWGANHYGKVDEIDGVGHIATQFGHLYYIPLIPTSSRFITGQEGDNFYYAPVSLSLKSILMAWLRTFSVLAMIGSLIFLIASDQGPMGGKLIPAILFALSIGLFFAFRMSWATKASYARAVDLAEQIGFDPRLRVYIDLHYGMINEVEADRRLDEVNAQLDELENLEEEIAASGMNQEGHFDN